MLWCACLSCVYSHECGAVSQLVEDWPPKRGYVRAAQERDIKSRLTQFHVPHSDTACMGKASLNKAISQNHCQVH